MSKKHPFIIGIDLGTTNCAVTWVDTREIVEDELPEIHLFPLPQLTGPGMVETMDTLPSFTYVPLEQELTENQLDLPWVEGREYAVGEFARKRGEDLPSRFVHSAKSWLCHEGVDRLSAILPFEAEAETHRFSPVDVTSFYLKHIVEAWNQQMVDEDNDDFRLEKQEVLITVPASFDAFAKELTVKAAHLAGIKKMTLLEEPQAAFYSWLYHNNDDWRDLVNRDDIVLVFDIGGGTSDFSLISVTEEEGDLVLNRFAVGEHILLGGDNMDMAIAAIVRQKLQDEGHKIDRWQFRKLCNLCRGAKETLLSGDEEQTVTLTLLGKGRSVVASTIKTEISRGEIEPLIMDGFFPETDVDQEPTGPTRGGLSELGLPYATDAGVTRHLARFLTNHARNESYRELHKEGEEESDFVRPTAILYNGGVMKSPLFQDRVAEQVAGWLDDELTILENENLDLAVAFGAAYYGLVKQGRGIRIRGGTARSYYMGLETSMPAIPGMEPPLKAVCLVPAKTEEGTILPLEGREFGLAIGREAEFRFLSSDTRKEEAVGVTLEEDEWNGQLEELDPLVTTLPADSESSQTIPVTIESIVTETGTIEVWCVERDGDRRWKLEFSYRDSGE